TRRRYRWLPGLSLDDVQPAELPQSIVDRLQAHSAKAEPKQESTDGNGIVEGERNNELFKLACELKRAGLGERSLLAALKGENAARGKPPLSESEVTAVARSAGTRGAQKKCDPLLELCSGLALWHSQDWLPYATLQVNGHAEHWPIRSRPFKRWV